MQTTSEHYQCAVVGGGLAGLCLAIQLADDGVSVIVFEKNTYPFHRVCGEYVSMESYDFLTRLGLKLNELDLPRITELGVSSEKGFILNAVLKMGGFGISRYNLEYYLYTLAKQKGVVVKEHCKVTQVEHPTENYSVISTTSDTYTADIVCGSFGKYTPAFAKDSNEPPSAPNYIGVKYHIKTHLASNRIELHNFSGGYCGVSKVDQDAYCLCYLADAELLRTSGNNIQELEQTLLHKNPLLKKYFAESDFLFDQPLTISAVSFTKKQAYVNNQFLLGDAAGSISPLCGNGMSMAMRGSSILATLITSYVKQSINKEQLILQYIQKWNKQFNTRITAGYYLQYLFGKKHTTHIALKVLNASPLLTNTIIGLTHGEVF